MAQHEVGSRFHFSRDSKYDIILGYYGYGLQEVATGRNPLWWNEDNFIGGFSTLEHAENAVDLLEDGRASATEIREWLFALIGL